MNPTLVRSVGVALLSVGGAVVSLASSYYFDVVHQPLLFMVLLNVGVGYLAPRRSWAYAPVFCLTMAAGYLYLKSIIDPLPDLVSFCTVISPFPSLLGIALGGLLRRVLNVN